ncbi:MAG: cobyrinate a,c-diamide synthase [Desulfarculaceae bacterium]|nr:cobyrinate a,c-diamide synthase [Desulfarculaceae bacterium]MCF8073543.1 cobyrinate a,c-diamide synthase [Desulfarculaceae bacterium]MCF8103065.1 cobyrinate a,c-diamide synthase [Desulfarculaceae bacterium]MCF8115741.1 cobyrinate a,c-diamide synthase [Desulfarculaceae bacterium]
MAPARQNSAPPRVVVAALRGGSGKTTLTLGLIQALADRGLAVAPFKKGPDYIDPFWLSEAAGAPCRNLDPYLMGRDQVRRSFAWHAAGYAAAVIEGNRGLFDGMDAAGSYSSAELAKMLSAPVVLALDCSMASRTVAAVALGCQRFDPELNLAGFILNPVGNPRQEGVVRAAVEQATGLPVLGAVPRLKLDLPERHMGLVPPQEHARVAEALHQAARSVAGHVDLDAVWSLMNQAPAWSGEGPPEGLLPPEPPQGPPVRIAVVRDAAFGFYYAENLEALTNFGAELVFCSALSDRKLPQADALYLGGGFPETHARSLAANQSFRDSLRQAAREGLPIYAECGGLMYLGRNLIVDNEPHAMAGVLPLDFAMKRRPQGHGYTQCEVDGENPFWPVGYQFKAHEFHYSEPRPLPDAELCFAYRVIRGKGVTGDRGGLVYRRVLGTYHHVHALGSPGWAPGLVDTARNQ